ncbi:aminotransferase class III-fold pyridoxal phosphate-dependent enzyme [Mycobacterium sp. CBMA293]|nr:aminotransferase class III-fold pyridoxal phosphate-dependent enzyme [Mycolicibacterium sp. CBMA 360]MUL62584.1 aminotransferase class III-fold pyridoxal phosphate-dependent enzyme [Mycolicibacterium sp. CBMA 335]MUL69036.1 aminotransferase class III-fold pyridoxal phosphate-dependent enzyme [Mycolicibacterium sp. CBMA 311]MUL96975.1 aminotransferase class III-fold pyridoxal phosphate-dependent enzyme [Mycolicibacterium sp. CBMA 230]MUM13420.1 aminotransferase class III-fold pyridoxal phosph
MNCHEALSLIPGESFTAAASLMERKIISRGRGSRVWDVDGREYVDYLLGSGPMLVGHAHPAVVEAVTRQVANGSSFYALNEKALELAAHVVERVPCAEAVQFCGSGGEATHYALRMARAATGRDAVLKFEGGFHGFNDYAMMSLFPKQPADLPRPEPSSAGVPAVLRDEVFVAKYNDLASVQQVFDAYPDRVAAIIVEPVQRAVSPLPGFLAGLRALADRYGAVLVFDEVVTGFRLARGGGQEIYGVIPDLATFGKVLGGGYPLAAVAGTKDILATTAPGKRPADGFVWMNGTLNGNPVASVAGIETLKLLDDAAYDRLNSLGVTLRTGIADVFARNGIPAQLLGVGPMFQTRLTERAEITDYRATLDFDVPLTNRIFAEVLARGFFLGAEKGYISLAHSDEDVELTLAGLEGAVHAVTGDRQITV